MSSDPDKCACGAPLGENGGCGNQIVYHNLPYPLEAQISIDTTDPRLGKLGEWTPPPADPEKEALRKELEDAKRELAEAREKLAQTPPLRKFKFSHEVVFTPKTDEPTT